MGGVVRKHKKTMQGRWLLEWWDETSMYDPEGVWQGGSECYMRFYRAWIPNSIKRHDVDEQMNYLETHPQAYV